MNISLKNKNVIITGASSGIGMVAAKLFAEEGANLALAARSKEKLTQLESDLNSFNVKVVNVPTDVSKISDCKALIKETVDNLGSIDILVNNAGFTSQDNLKDIPINDIDQTIEVNLKAPIKLTKLALPELIKSPSGRVINVASILGIIPIPTEATYSATKFGIRAFSYSLAEELENTNVKVCIVSPGPVDTPFIMEKIEKIHDLVFSPPVSTSREIAELIIKSAKDGKMERIKPVHTGILAKIGFLLPPIARIVKPIMVKQGKKRKEQYIKKNSPG